ncbi:OmpA family protein [Sphingomonas sp.]|uniref:OmpA family protein n=1 Tax=Sphingomonas sp. TaxID=28214 RepID=UPI000DB0E16F|nr:OmpA family protein [Sphingomonas sp.]PZU08639.1 MAG: OmpA family protein [Sphingomonas sp.]
MTRLLFLLLFVLVGVAALLGIKSCQEARHPVISAPAQDFGGKVAILGDGTPIFAPNGTIARALADWLADPKSTRRYFEVGGRQFVGHTDEPTPETRARMTRLVAMLAGSPAVKVEIVGHAAASGNPAADMALSHAHAERARAMLVEEGISADRLSVSTRGAGQPLPGLRPDDPRNDRIGLLMTAPDRPAD